MTGHQDLKNATQKMKCVYATILVKCKISNIQTNVDAHARWVLGTLKIYIRFLALL